MAEEQTQSTEEPSFSGIEDALAFMETKNVETESEDNEDTEAPEGDVKASESDNAEVLDDVDEEVDEEDEGEEIEASEDDGEDSEPEFKPYTFGEGDDAVTVNSLEEAKSGFMRSKDYTVKTTELKREREGLSEITDGLLEKKAEYVEALGLLKASTDQNLKEYIGVDWIALEKDDPYSFEEKKNSFDAARLQYEQTLELEKAQTEELNAERQQQNQLLQQRAIDDLIAARPEVAEGDKFEKAVQNMVEQYGFSADEIIGTNDKRLWLAMLDLAGKRPARKSKSKVVTMKPKAASTVTKSQKSDKRRKEAFNRPGGVDLNTALGLMGIDR